MSYNNLKEILNHLDIIEKAYDAIRLIDPVNRVVIDVQNNKSRVSGIHCYAFWCKNEVCNNCITIKAYRNTATYIKMEYIQNEVYMITAIPVELQERIVILELIKNVTDSLVMDSGSAITHSEIHELIDNMNSNAHLDALTNIYNRRYINEQLPIQVLNSGILGQKLSVIMADIDFFKNVNDNYGHLVGDYALQHFSTILKRGLHRATDWVARYGGEEFLICLPGAGKDKAFEIAESIRKEVEDSVVDDGTHKFKITASFGICSIIPENSTRMEDLIEEADRMLYLAKSNGRNRVEA